MPGDSPIWHPEAIAEESAAALRSLHGASLLDGFYLAGGTGLALHFGHRLSHDIDLFSPAGFDEDRLLQRVQTQPGFALTAKAPQTLHAIVSGTKVSLPGCIS